MYEKEKQAMIDCALQMLRYGLVALSGGNICMRAGDSFLVTPSAMLYEGMTPADIVRVDADANVLESSRRPSSDLSAALYILNRRDDVNVIIHTHQPYATAVGLIADEFPACLTTVVDTAHGPVPVAPFTPSSDEGMGVAALEKMGNSGAVILKNHGLLVAAADMDEALETAVYLEEAAKCYLAARAVAPVAPLSAAQIADEDAERGNYGQ